jgi:hypothetical protein
MKTARRQKDEGHRVAREECDTKKGDDAPGVGRMTNIAIRTVGDHSWVFSTRKMREKARPIETIEWRRRAWPSAKRPVPKSTIGSRSTEEGPRPSISRRPRSGIPTYSQATLTYSVCSREGGSVAASRCAVAAAGNVGEDGSGCGVLSLSQPHIGEMIAPRDRFILGVYLKLVVAACGACGRRAGAVGNPVGGEVCP